VRHIGQTKLNGKTLGADKMAYGMKKKKPGKTGTGKKKY
jgi:hypothetical protein